MHLRLLSDKTYLHERINRRNVRVYFYNLMLLHCSQKKKETEIQTHTSCHTHLIILLYKWDNKNGHLYPPPPPLNAIKKRFFCVTSLSPWGKRARCTFIEKDMEKSLKSNCPTRKNKSYCMNVKHKNTSYMPP